MFLKRSKTDQFGRGAEVFIGATVNDLCPIEAIRAYVARRGTAPGAFFCGETRFVVFTRAGIPVSGYSGHSFRIGDDGRLGRNTRFDHPSTS